MKTNVENAGEMNAILLYEIWDGGKKGFEIFHRCGTPKTMETDRV